jgi:hypothetical protein
VKRADVVRKFYEEVQRGNLKVDPVSGVITRTNMAEVVLEYLKKLKATQRQGTGHKADCPKEAARIDGRDRWYMMTCDCTGKSGADGHG